MKWWDWLRLFALPGSGVTDRDRAQLVMALSMRVSLFAFMLGLAALAVGIMGDGCDGGKVIVAILLALAASGAGTFIGFLFGIPKTLQADDKTVRLSYQVNTNLEQISDWLTKMIVGIALVDLNKLPGRLAEVGGIVGGSLGPSGHLIAQTSICYFAILGFFFGYLATRLYLAPSFPFADRVGFQALVHEAAAAVAEVSRVDPLQPPKERAHAAPTPAVERLARAAQTAAPDARHMTPSEARNTALALYLSGEFAAALPYFARADEQPVSDPRFAIQHAISLGEAGRRAEAVSLLEEVVHSERAPLEARKLLGYYLLWFPERLHDALRYTNEYLTAVGLSDSGAFFNLACANAQLYEQKKESSLEDLAIADLRRAIAMDKRWCIRAHELRTDDFRALSDKAFAEATAACGK